MEQTALLSPYPPETNRKPKTNKAFMKKLYTILSVLALAGFLVASGGNSLQAQSQNNYPFLAFEGSLNEDAKMYLSWTQDLQNAYRTELLYDADNNYDINNVIAAAYHPMEDAVYVIASTNPSGAADQRIIFKVDTLLGELTFVANPQDDYWQTLAISNDGRFFSTASSQTGLNPDVIYEIDITTGAASPMVLTPGGVTVDNGLAYNADNGLLYYLADNNDLTTDSSLVSYDPANNFSANEITFTQDVNFFPKAATYLGNDSLLLSDATTSFSAINVAGGGPEPVASFNYGSVIVAFATMYGNSTARDEAFSAEAQANIDVYPNPTSGALHIEAPELELQQLRLLSIDGRQVAHRPVAARHTAELNTQRLSPGVYILHLQTEEGQMHKRVIVQ